MLCLLTLSTLLFVALIQHLIQSTMRCENCINSVDIDSIECIRDPCLVSTVLTCILLIVWLKSPESQLSKTFCGLKICHRASQALDVQKTRRITTEPQQCYLQLLLLIVTSNAHSLYIESVEMCR